MALLTGLGGLLGAASNTTAARTGTNSTSTTGGSTGTSTPVFNSGQTGVQGTTANALNQFITNGPNLTPAMTTGTNSINQTYKGIGDQLQQSLASRGFGNGGASGTAGLQTSIAAGGAVGNLQAQLEASAQQQQLQALGTATGFGFASPGTTGSTATSGTQNGSYVVPGSEFAGGLSGALTAFNSQENGLAAMLAAGGLG